MAQVCLTHAGGTLSCVNFFEGVAEHVPRHRQKTLTARVRGGMPLFGRRLNISRSKLRAAERELTTLSKVLPTVVLSCFGTLSTRC
jgi:hypothetical protein